MHGAARLFPSLFAGSDRGKSGRRQRLPRGFVRRFVRKTGSRYHPASHPGWPWRPIVGCWRVSTERPASGASTKAATTS